MQSADWVEFFRRLPVEQHANVLLSGKNGQEIALQGLLRIEREFLLVKGRPAGTSDSRVFFFPFDNLAFVQFIHPVSDEKLAEYFGTLIKAVSQEEAAEAAAFAASASGPQAPPTPMPTPTPAKADATPTPGLPTPPPSRSPGAGSVSALRDLIRRRTAAAKEQKPKSE